MPLASHLSGSCPVRCSRPSLKPLLLGPLLGLGILGCPSNRPYAPVAIDPVPMVPPKPSPPKRQPPHRARVQPLILF